MDGAALDILNGSIPCGCGQTHRVPVEACHVGQDAAAELGRFARERCGEACLVVSDENTGAAGGQPVVESLSRYGKHIVEHVYGDGPLEATMELADALTPRAAEQDFVVAVGSGTISDLAKWAGDKSGRPVLLFGTAASMNGYASGIVALKVRGLKRTLPCTPAVGVFADPAVMATAPGRMNAAGVADFLSKCASAADWYTAHFLRGDYYCRRSSDLLARGTAPVLATAAGVGRRELDAVEALANALMISGLSLLLAGSSAPGSGGEHLISHYLDMKHALCGTPNDLHGAQVGVGTVHCLGLWQRILALDTVNLDIEACVAAQPSAETIEAWIRDDWGPVVGAEVLAQWREKALDAGGLRAEVAKFAAEIDQRREVLERELLAPEVVEEAITAAGGPTTPEDLDAPVEEYHKALRYARFIRNRFTVLDLAAELCVP